MDLLYRAFEQHRAGHEAEACRLYREVLIQCPGQPDALHLLGLLEREGKEADHGITLIRRSLISHPGLIDVYHNLVNQLYG